MKGPFLLNEIDVYFRVPSTISYGTYIITNAQNQVLYVGRSDTNLQRRIKDHVREKGDYHSFYYEEAFCFTPFIVACRVTSCRKGKGKIQIPRQESECRRKSQRLA